MKKLPILAIAAGSILWLTSCEEKGPLINFEDGPAASDTTYVASPETPQTKRILVEEFTGASCTNCPAAADKLTNLNNDPAFKDRLVIIGLHQTGLGLAQPVRDDKHWAKYDFTREEAKQIGDQIFGGVSNIPAAGFDRAQLAGKSDLFLYTPDWAAAVQNRLNEANADLNVHVTSLYNEEKKEAAITVKVAYTKELTGDHALSVAITEGNLVDIQKFTDKVEEDYDFEHVFRDMITPLTGTPFLIDMPTKEAGRVFEQTFLVPVDAEWNPDNCHVIAFVHNTTTNKEVLQVTEAPLKP